MNRKQLILCLLTLLGSITAHAYDLDVNGVFYNITNADAKTVEVTYVEDGEGNADFYAGPITIPNRISKEGITYTVTAIGEKAFKYCNSLTSVSVGANVTSIGTEAFMKCSALTTVSLPNGLLTIGYSAFDDCYALANISIPSTVTFIDGAAFADCRSLTSITLPEGIPSIGNYLISGCTGLTEITIPGSVTSIGDFAFYGCSNLATIVIPDGITTIGDGAFENCSVLTSISLPDEITSIGEFAFKNCQSLTSFTIPTGISEIKKITFEKCRSLTSIFIPDNITSIGEYAFEGCDNLTTVTISNNVTSIGANAFENCTNLTTINLPENLTTLGAYAFIWCSGLTSITIPSGVTTIPEMAFRGCTSLTSLILPASINNIENNAFDGCSGLPYLMMNATVPPTIGSDILIYTTSPIYVPTASLETYKTAEGWSAYADRIQPQTDWTFTAAVPCGEGTADLTFKVTNANPWEVEVSASPEDIAGALTIPATVQNENGIEFAVKRIADWVFSGRQGLTSVSLPETLYQIGDGMFYNCANLASINIPTGVVSIHLRAFSGCTALTSVTLPEGLSYIGENAFSNSGLESITFPSTLTTVGYEAFRDCKDLQTIDFNHCSAYFEYGCFAGCSSLETLSIPNTVKFRNTDNSWAWNCFINCMSLRTVVFEGFEEGQSRWGTTSLFSNCSALESVVLPYVDVMQHDFFYNCTGLRSVTFLEVGDDFNSRHWNFNKVFRGLNPDLIQFTVPAGTAEKLLKAGYMHISDKSALPLVRSEFEAEAARIGTMADALTDGDKTTLSSAISAARSAVNAAEDYAEVYAQIAAIKAAANSFLSTATLSEGFDVTAAYVVNPDFDNLQLGWDIKQDWVGHPNVNQRGWNEASYENGDVTIDKFIDTWENTISANGTIEQTITNLPAGIYRFEVDVIATNQNDASAEITGVSLFAGNSSTAIATENQKPQHFSIKFEHAIDGNVQIGINIIDGSNANWVAMDNVRLIYEGKAADIPQGIDLASDENARVYLYNVETGKYLSAGHSGGTHAMLDETGLPIRLTQNPESGLWQIYFWEGSKSNQLLFKDYESNEVYVDYDPNHSNADENLTLWSITQAGDGSYLIQNKMQLNTGDYLGNIPTRQDAQINYNGISYTDLINTATVNDNSHWLIFTKENSDQLAAKSRLMAAILRMEASDNVNDELLATARTVYNNADATAAEVIDITTQLNSQMGMPAENQPVDMTALIINPRFENNTTEGWSGANVVGGRVDATSNHEQEFYQKNFNMYQTITGVPNGIYRLKWKGFHRPGERSAVYTEYTAGTDNASAVVYANSVQKTMKNIASEMSDTRLDGTDFEGNGRYYPDAMEGARKYFDAGFYADQLEVEVTDNVLTIGVKNTEPMASRHWVIFSDFELYIMENAEQVNNKLVASSGQGVNGGRATLPVNMTNGDDIAGIQFKVRLPEGMTMNTNASGQLKVTKTSRTSAMSLQASNRGDYYQVLMYSIDDAVSAGSGAIAKMEMNLAETLGLGDYNVDIYDVVLTKRDGLRIKPFSATGTMTIVDAQLGDANHDGDVDVADIISIANYILGSASGSFDMTAADVNGDGDVDVADIIGIANIILGGQSSQVKANVMDMQEETLLDPQ